MLVSFLSVIIIIPVICFLSLMFIFPGINNYRVERIKKEYLNITLPIQTEIIETYTFCSNTTGTDNHVEIWMIEGC